MWKDSETEIDYLDFEYLVQVLESTILNDKLLPASIGVYGDWGSGKSSLIRMCMKDIKEKDAKSKCIMFNGWLFEGYEDAKTAIIGSILDAIYEDETLPDKAKKLVSALYKNIDKFKLVKTGVKVGLDLFTTGGLGTITSFAFKTLIDKASGITNETVDNSLLENVKDDLDNKDIRNDIRKFQSNFSELIKEAGISRMVIFIDELDRCRPDTILDTLEAMRLFLFNGNVAFVIGADERQISYAIKLKFAGIEESKIDIGKEYLEKLIQYPIRIPRLNVKETEIYLTCLLLQNDLKEDDFTKVLNQIKTGLSDDFQKFEIGDIQKSIGKDMRYYTNVLSAISIAQRLSFMLNSGLNGNPRQFKRFLNAWDMRIQMADKKHKHIDKSILAKVMMLEYVLPQLFTEMSNLSAKDKLAEKLRYLEGSEADKGSANLKMTEETSIKDDREYSLSKWKDNPWVQQWCGLEPMLQDKDLSLCFYLTRTALENQIVISGFKLSPRAHEIYRKLISKSESIINQAIKKSSEVSDAEASQILRMIFDSVMAEGKIITGNILLFKALLDWGSSRQILYAETLSYLNAILAENISISAAPLVVGFGVKISNIKDVKKVTDKWCNTKQTLSVAFEQEYKRNEVK